MSKVGFQSHYRAISVVVTGALFSGDIYQILEKVRNIQHSIFYFSILYLYFSIGIDDAVEAEMSFRYSCSLSRINNPSYLRCSKIRILACIMQACVEIPHRVNVALNCNSNKNLPFNIYTAVGCG